MGNLSVEIDSELMSQLLKQIRPLETFSTLIRRIADELNSERMLRGLFQRYVPSEFIDRIITYGLEGLKDPNDSTQFDKNDIVSTVTHLFCSIDGYMDLTERLEVKTLTRLLDQYLSTVSEEVVDHNGLVDKCMADRIMAYWGGPGINQNDAFLACECALALLGKIAILTANLPESQQFHIRVGINSGAVSLRPPPAGLERRWGFTLIGDAVNVASALEEANKKYGTHILIGEDTYKQISGAVTARRIDAITLKSKKTPVAIYELLDVNSAVMQKEE
jgi:adenylate cyclase